MFYPEQRVAANRRWHLLVNVIAASGLVTPRQRAKAYRLAGLCFETEDIRPGCFFLSADVKIGIGSMIGRDCYFEAPVHIGEGCFVAMQTLFGTWTHAIGAPSHRAGEVDVRPVVIENGCWLGARSLVAPGITVAQGCVLAAGSVVIRNCEPHGLYAGVPAVRKRDLT